MTDKYVACQLYKHYETTSAIYISDTNGFADRFKKIDNNEIRREVFEKGIKERCAERWIARFSFNAFSERCEQ